MNGQLLQFHRNVSLSNIVIPIALSENWSIVFPLIVRCPNTEKKQNKYDMKNTVLILKVFGFSYCCQRLCIRIVRFCVRGFSAGKSEVTKVHCSLFKH